DVLQRHQAVHEKATAEGRTPLRRPKERALKACEPCATAKLSCDNDRPCKRCQRNQVECVARTAGAPRKIRNTAQNSSQDYAVDLMSPSDVSASTSTPAFGLAEFRTPVSTSYKSSDHEMYDSSLDTRDPALMFNGLLPPGQQPHDRPYSPLNIYPAFFEQIMLSGLDPEPAPRHPRVFDFMQDIDFDFPPTENDIFGIDYLPDLDQILDTTGALRAFEFPQQPSLDDQESASHRAAAFQRSLWRWVPEKNQHAFSEEERIPMRDSDGIPPTQQTRLDGLKIPGQLSMQARDEILQLVARTAGSRLSISAFPSPEYLGTLIKIGIGKRVETDAWVHPYTLFDQGYQHMRPELLTALVAAGCVCCGIPSISKTGIILQEIARVSLAELVEKDNSVLRDLQYLQASMLWLDIGIFCGYTRKMQIAESYLQPLCTALRRAAAFDRSTYTTITPFSLGDDDQSLQRAWYSWVRQESLKRLVYHLFGHDVEVATAMNRPFIISSAGLTLPFPAARDLWLAPSAIAWRDIWTRSHVEGTSELNLRDLLSDPSLISHIPPDLDSGLSRSALIQGLVVQVWEFRQQMLLSSHRATTRLWLQTRQEDLYTTLRDVQADLPNSPAVTIMMHEFVMMYLHIDIDAIQRFVGRMGELEARRAYPGLRDWSHTKEARAAIWHAGQVLRAARAVAPYQLRGFDSLSIYHAALVLWVYGLLQCGDQQQPYTSTREAGRPPMVTLDGGPEPSIKAFLTRGIGRPGLTICRSPESDLFCELSQPRSVMAATRQVFEGNCPRGLADNNLPPMIQNLCALIEDLGNL
ncbi:hypothetical protein BO71DRAFT_304736, partial [Aspergillus ellipticus CBS 707.79]